MHLCVFAVILHVDVSATTMRATKFASQTNKQALILKAVVICFDNISSFGLDANLCGFRSFVSFI